MPELSTAERLLQERRTIIDLWEERASREVVAARHLTSLVLRDELERFLELLASALSAPRGKALAQGHTERAISFAKHGKLRAGSVGYLLREVIFEFHILRQVLFDFLEDKGPLELNERNIILDFIEQAVNDAAVGFSDRIRDIQEYFAVTLTHDLRGPLTASKAAAQMILRRPDRSGQVTKLAFHVIESMERLDLMIRDILNASKLKAGEALQLEFQQFDLVGLLKEVVDEFRISNPERFVLKLPENLVGQWSYEGLRRVLQNLIANALKYGGSTTPITVTLEDLGERIRFKVHNEGNPISPDKRARLFESYRQLRGSSSKAGWGLGLFLAKGIVDSHGGTIEVSSDPNVGTDFIVEMPRSSQPISGVLDGSERAA